MTRRQDSRAFANVMAQRGKADGVTDVSPAAAPEDASARPRGNAKQSDVTGLYKRQARRLTTAIRSLFGHGPPDPEDVTQLAFQKLLERPDHSDIRDLDAFLWRTARNLVLKAKRAQDVRSRHDFEIEHLFFPLRRDNSTSERVLIAREQLQAINEALREMPARRRRAFLLHKVEGLSVSDVARRLKIGRTTAHKHIVRAGQLIDVHLAKQQGEKK